jgi:L-alanine-DL-glutamate epimerase-like enolase superfamily enzyme
MPSVNRFQLIEHGRANHSFGGINSVTRKAFKPRWQTLVKITKIETFSVSASWKNWLFVRVLTDSDVYGISEATINGFTATTETAVHELSHFVIGKDPRQINAIANAIITTIADVGHIHRMVMGAIEVACWDILGKTLGVPIWNCWVESIETRSWPTRTVGTGRNALRRTLWESQKLL